VQLRLAVAWMTEMTDEAPAALLIRPALAET